MKKGSRLYLEGSLQTRKWADKDGNDRYSTEVVLQAYGGSLVMLDGKQEEGGQSSGQGRQDNPEAEPQPSFAREDPDDEVPF